MKINTGNFKRIFGGDRLSARGLYEKRDRGVRGFHSVSTGFTSANPGQEPEFNFRDDGIRRRLRALDYPALPKARRDSDFRRRLLESAILLAQLFAELIERARANPDAPNDIPLVEATTERMRTEDVGDEALAWIRSALVKTERKKGARADKLHTAAIYRAAVSAADSGEDKSTGTAWGYSMRDWTSLVRIELDLDAPLNVRIGKRNGSGWRGLRFADADERQAALFGEMDGADSPDFAAEFCHSADWFQVGGALICGIHERAVDGACSGEDSPSPDSPPSQGLNPEAARAALAGLDFGAASAVVANMDADELEGLQAILDSGELRELVAARLASLRALAGQKTFPDEILDSVESVRDLRADAAGLERAAAAIRRGEGREGWAREFAGAFGLSAAAIESGAAAVASADDIMAMLMSQLGIPADSDKKIRAFFTRLTLPQIKAWARETAKAWNDGADERARRAKCPICGFADERDVDAFGQCADKGACSWRWSAARAREEMPDSSPPPDDGGETARMIDAPARREH